MYPSVCGEGHPLNNQSPHPVTGLEMAALPLYWEDLMATVSTDAFRAESLAPRRPPRSTRLLTLAGPERTSPGAGTAREPEGVVKAGAHLGEHGRALQTAGVTWPRLSGGSRCVSPPGRVGRRATERGAGEETDVSEP